MQHTMVCNQSTYYHLEILLSKSRFSVEIVRTQANTYYYISHKMIITVLISCC